MLREPCDCEPEWQPGMPVPAGTGLNRRGFLLRSAGAALTVYGAGKLLGEQALGEGVAAAAALPDRPVLVSIFLAGGVDSLSVLAPVGDARYRHLRPKLHLSGGQPFAEDHRLHWHPAAAPIAQLHKEGKVAVLPAIGYDHPDQSHFTSRHFYEVGSTDRQLRTGWLGRFLDVVGSADNPLQGLSLDGKLSPILAAGAKPVAAIADATGYEMWTHGVSGDTFDDMLLTARGMGLLHASGGDPALAASGLAATNAMVLRGQLQPFRTSKPHAPVAYPSSASSAFPDRLADLAALIDRGMPISCATLTAPGAYDTHDNQPGELASGLELTAKSLAAFQRDLETRGLANRVLVHVWSEFGRRAAENASLGTDHGAAGLGLLIGSRVRGKMIGEFPGLKRLDKDGNLRPTADFRGLYCAMLEQWFGVDAAQVIPGAARFKRPQLLS